MPLYEYYCETCDGTFEKTSSMKEMKSVERCPGCRRPADRHITSFSVGGLGDTAYNRDFCNGSQFESDPETGDYLAKKARQAGVSITGKVYRSSLAEYHGDPGAWTAGIDDARELCKRRGYKHKIVDGVLECSKVIDLEKKDLPKGA